MKYYVRITQDNFWYVLFSEVLPESIYVWAPHSPLPEQNHLKKFRGISWSDCNFDVAEFDSIKDFHKWFAEEYFMELL